MSTPPAAPPPAVCRLLVNNALTDMNNVTNRFANQLDESSGNCQLATSKNCVKYKYCAKVFLCRIREKRKREEGRLRLGQRLGHCEAVHQNDLNASLTLMSLSEKRIVVQSHSRIRAGDTHTYRKRER